MISDNHALIQAVDQVLWPAQGGRGAEFLCLRRRDFRFSGTQRCGQDDDEDDRGVITAYAWADSVALAIGQIVVIINRFSMPWSPPAWPGPGLQALVRGEWLPALAYLTMSVGLATGVFALSLSVVERLYYSGWFKVRSTPGRKAKRVAVPLAERERVGWLPFMSPPVWGIVLKDFRVLRRGLHNLSQLLSPIISGIIGVVMISHASRRGADEQAV